jgi:transposase
LVGEVRQNHGRKPTTTLLIIDAQSVKNYATAEHKGYDAGKKISGLKRHIAVDSQGFPHAFAVSTANVSDKAGAIAMFEQYGDELSSVHNVLADGGYQGQPFAAAVQDNIGASVAVATRNELRYFAVQPKRWIVERTLAWLEHCHRLWKNCERKLTTSLQMMVLAFVALLLKRF